MTVVLDPEHGVVKQKGGLIAEDAMKLLMVKEVMIVA